MSHSLLTAFAIFAILMFGSVLRPWLTSPRAVRTFNIPTAILLPASLYPVFVDA